MQVIILAAGYATRLYPLTKNKPKPLLPIAGRPIIEHILECLTGAPALEKVIVVTNQKFYDQFQAWSNAYAHHLSCPIQIVNDQSTCDDDKLGAIGDLYLVIKQCQINSDILVIAGDNLFDQSIVPFVEFSQDNHAPVLAVYDVQSLDEIKKFAAITLDDDNVITHFEEKPDQPKTTLAGIALYYYPASVVSLVDTYIMTGNNPDQPGRFVQWLYTRVPVMGWKVPGAWYDIGTHDTLAEADRIFTTGASSL